MRTPAHRGLRGWFALAVVLATVSAGCGEAAVTPAPTVRPTPVVTPDPHLGDPTTADAVFLGLGAGGLRLTANNAGTGEGDLVKRINATYQGWPLVVSEFRSTAALAAATAWDGGDGPAQGEAPVQIAGLNILIEWGPTTGAEPKSPAGAQLEALRALAERLDVLISPLRARSVVPVPGVARATTGPGPSDDAVDQAATDGGDGEEPATGE